MSSDWQRLREVLNHKWLKNEFMQHLRAFVARAQATSPDLARLSEFAVEDWPKWEVNQRLIKSLLDCAETELNPCQIFDQAPLSRCPAESKVWLSDVIHGLWLARTSIRKRIEDARSALTDADEKYHALAPIFANGRIVEIERVRQASGELQAFASNVNRLSTLVSLLPDKYELI